ncbi:MAG: type II toxin-antitoxin system VapC family toxin [Gemmatimonadetes bacterium]|nr:type II toxin-antitoxin system VapC family toxin [Gemmatimonadota bacterium]
MYYLDTSAAVKLLIAEEGTDSLVRWLDSHEEQVFSSDLLRTELLRVTRRIAPDLMVQARAILDALVLLTLSTELCERAAILEPRLLRSLDAIHLAAAMEMGDGLRGLVTYDRRLAAGAESLGIKVLPP